jgi:hypothetical protein
MIFFIIGKLDIFPLMCAAVKVWIIELTLIHKNIRSVRNSHISQSDVMSSPFTLKIFLGERHILSLVLKLFLSDSRRY